MQAVVYDRFGPPNVLQLAEVPAPRPGDDQVLIRVRATTVTSAEAAMRRGRPLWGRVIIGLFRPRRSMRTLGMEFAGEIAEVGPAVTRFAVGEAVYGFTGFDLGANAQYLCLPQRASIAPKPSKLSFEEAAAVVDGASTALYFLRDKAAIRAGQRVLIIGASGSIGTSAVQIARHFGAHVTGVCSTGNVALVEDLGAHEVVDYTREDFRATGNCWDLIFDTVGKAPFFGCRHALTRRGIYVTTTGLHNYALDAWTRLWPGRRVMTGMSVEKNAALALINELVESGALRTVVDRRYPLDDIAEAHRYVDTGRKRGNVVIEIPLTRGSAERGLRPTVEG